MGGCLGCFTRPQLIIAVDEPSKGLKIQGRSVKKTSLPDDIWSSSYEMDNSAVQSQRSISSMSASNQNLDPHGGSGSTSNPSEFVNNGLLLWNQMRQQWVGDRKSRNQPKMREPRLRLWRWMVRNRKTKASEKTGLGLWGCSCYELPLSGMSWLTDFLVRIEEAVEVGTICQTSCSRLVNRSLPGIRFNSSHFSILGVQAAILKLECYIRDSTWDK